MTTPIADCIERSGPPLPWLFGLAGRIEGEERGSLLSDAGALSRSLSTAADLFGLPAVSTSFDTTLEAEAAGADVDLGGERPRVVGGCVASVDDALDIDVAGATERGRVPAVLDTTDRLVPTLDGTSVLGGITGPRRLADSLLVGGADDDVPDDLGYEAALVAGDLAIELANAYLERGADGIAVLEPDGVEDSDRYRDAMVPLANVIDHFGGTGVVVQRTVEADDVALAADLGFDAITGRADDPASVADAADGAGVTVGIGVPRERFVDGPEAVVAYVADLPPDVLLSSEWEVPMATDPETIHGLMGSR